jgi:hypothetical protein
MDSRYLLNLGHCHWLFKVSELRENIENEEILAINLKCGKATTNHQENALKDRVMMKFLKIKVER